MNEKYEMFFTSEKEDVIAIDGWWPISTDRIKHPERIPHYLEIGLIRKIELSNKKQTADDADSSLDEQLEQFLHEKCPGKLPDDYEIPGALMLLIVQFVKAIAAEKDAEIDWDAMFPNHPQIVKEIKALPDIKKWWFDLAYGVTPALFIAYGDDGCTERIRLDVSKYEARIAELEAKLAASRGLGVEIIESDQFLDW